MSKESRKILRKQRAQVREQRWASDYEAKQAKALGDPTYKLPEAKRG